MGGLEATQTLRASQALGATAKIPVVAMTAYAMAGDREKFLEAGMDDYVAKPVELADLLGAIARVMGARTGA